MSRFDPLFTTTSTLHEMMIDEAIRTLQLRRKLDDIERELTVDRYYRAEGELDRLTEEKIKNIKEQQKSANLRELCREEMARRGINITAL
jgi:hypothetical protein